MTSEIKTGTTDIDVIHIEDGTITVVCHPADDDEGWDRLDEVGEW